MAFNTIIRRSAPLAARLLSTTGQRTFATATRGALVSTALKHNKNIGGSSCLGPCVCKYCYSSASSVEKTTSAVKKPSADEALLKVIDSEIQCSVESFEEAKSYGSLREFPAPCKSTGIASVASAYRESNPGLSLRAQLVPHLTNRGVATLEESHSSDTQDASATATEVPSRIKFKRLDKTARHIMQILDKESVEQVRTEREIPEIKPGYIIQLRLEVPENKRRVSTVKGIVIARRNAGLNTTIRLRRLVAGVGVESLLPLYSPNVKEIKVLDKKKVRRAKLYYLRDKMNALRK